MIKYIKYLLIIVVFNYLPINLSAETLELNFSNGSNGFVGDFADYPVGTEDFYELSWGWENLLSQTELKKGLYLSGNNHSDDLWMYVKRRIDGLQPNTAYEL